MPGQNIRLALPIVNFFLVDYSTQGGMGDRLPVAGGRSVKNAGLAAVSRLPFSQRDNQELGVQLPVFSANYGKMDDCSLIELIEFTGIRALPNPGPGWNGLIRNRPYGSEEPADSRRVNAGNWEAFGHGMYRVFLENRSSILECFCIRSCSKLERKKVSMVWQLASKPWAKNRRPSLF